MQAKVNQTRQHRSHLFRVVIGLDSNEEAGVDVVEAEAPRH